jgi:hypothetical protein
MSQIIALPPRPARLSAKLRAAIEVHVTEGLSIVAACEKTGMSRAGYHKAMKRAAVRDYLEEVQARFVGDVKAKRALYQARALEVAMDLMMTSKSEAIRARMVEFLASDAKVSPVAVHVDARQVQQPQGYIYTRPADLAATAAAPVEPSAD